MLHCCMSFPISCFFLTCNSYQPLTDQQGIFIMLIVDICWWTALWVADHRQHSVSDIFCWSIRPGKQCRELDWFEGTLISPCFPWLPQGLYSLSGKTSYRQISWCLEASRLDVAMVVLLWNLTGTSAATLPRYLPNFRAIEKVLTRISRLRDFTRSCGRTSYRLVNRGPDSWCMGIRGALQYKDHFQGVGIPIKKIKQLQACLFFLMGVPIMVRWCVILKWAVVATSIEECKIDCYKCIALHPIILRTYNSALIFDNCLFQNSGRCLECQDCILNTPMLNGHWIMVVEMCDLP